ncbi:MAG: bifunctional hydroxymethylpyrimidine kinase/phosphomethylpyrimidine kinase [Sulfurovum sp.]|nr:bifunctional hydroxymethylpyrimidine kinase/phosphomethylpyrimidine kinase [Sulfurovum sp.]
MPDNHTPTVLTIAGFDPYGGAGIQIDTKTIHALGGYALSAITAVTAQNSRGVAAVEAVSAQTLRKQLCTLLDDIAVDAVKIGMLVNAELIEVVSDVIRQYRLKNVVLDTVLVSSSGTRLLETEAIETMIVKLFPLCRLITPNLHETNTLLQADFEGSAKEVPRMAEGLFSLGARNILLKGGHTIEPEAVDCLVSLSSITRFSTPRVDTTHTHGTGCLLSSAIATSLAKGESLAESVKQAKHFLYEKLQDSDKLVLRYHGPDRTQKEPIF